MMLIGKDLAQYAENHAGETPEQASVRLSVEQSEDMTMACWLIAESHRQSMPGVHAEYRCPMLFMSGLLAGIDLERQRQRAENEYES